MGDTIRKICYSAFLVIFLGLGITGIVYNPEDQTDGRSETTKSEVILCSLSTESYVDEEKTEVDFTREQDVNIVLTNGTITGRIVNEKIIYKDINRYTLRKERLTSSGASYTFNDEEMSYSYKRTLESNALHNVSPTEEAIKKYFTDLGYTCK